MAFTEELFSDGLDNSMAGGPTLGLFKNPDGTSGAGSGVVPPPDSPAVVAITALSAISGTGTDPLTINAANTLVTAINTRLAAVESLRLWMEKSGDIKPPA